jgi:hypothetical protein
VGGRGLPARVRAPGARTRRQRRSGGPRRARIDRILEAGDTPAWEDPIDATAIARAALREGIDTLPVAFLDDQAHEIRVLSDYRRQLVSERVRLINRLRWHLVQIAPDVEVQIRAAGESKAAVRVEHRASGKAATGPRPGDHSFHPGRLQRDVVVIQGAPCPPIRAHCETPGGSAKMPVRLRKQVSP